MTSTFNIDLQHGLIFWMLEGVVSSDSLITAMKEIYTAPDFHPNFSLFGDFSKASFCKTSTDALIECAKLNQFSEKSRQYLLVGSVCDFAVLRIFDAYCSIFNKPAPFIFTDRADALSCINADIESR